MIPKIFPLRLTLSPDQHRCLILSLPLSGCLRRRRHFSRFVGSPTRTMKAGPQLLSLPLARTTLSKLVALPIRNLQKLSCFSSSSSFGVPEFSLTLIRFPSFAN